MIRAGPPWSDALHAQRDAVLEARRAARASSDPPQSWPSLAEFYAGRAVFITGGSGFMGRVLLEFLLRCCPDVGSVYLVLRPRRGVSPDQRLSQLTDVPLFDRLRREQPNALSKVVVLAGDVALPALGLSAEDRVLLARSVSVIFHCAASVRFDDPFQKAVFTNLRSTRDLIQLAREMPQLKALVHVSTAYAFTDQPVIGERVYPTHLDWRDVIRWAEGLSDADAQRVDWLGHKLRDFQPNTYTFTKALAERLVEDEAKDLPAVIARPSVVMASIKDPLPGWVDNLNGPMAMYAAAQKGILQVFPFSNTAIDTIPVDSATKIILLTSWLKGIGKSVRATEGPADSVDVVNVTLGNGMGVNTEECAYCCQTHMLKHVPFPGGVRWPRMTYTSSSRDLTFKLRNFYQHLCFAVMLDFLARLSGQQPRALKIYRKITTAFQALEPFGAREFTFEVRNQENTNRLLHPADEQHLDYCDLYLVRDNPEAFHKLIFNSLRGILNYALKERDDPKRNFAHLQRVYWYEFIYHFFMLAVFGGILYIFGVGMGRSYLGTNVMNKY